MYEISETGINFYKTINRKYVFTIFFLKKNWFSDPKVVFYWYSHTKTDLVFCLATYDWIFRRSITIFESRDDFMLIIIISKKFNDRFIFQKKSYIFDLTILWLKNLHYVSTFENFSVRIFHFWNRSFLHCLLKANFFFVKYVLNNILIKSKKHSNTYFLILVSLLKSWIYYD